MIEELKEEIKEEIAEIEELAFRLFCKDKVKEATLYLMESKRSLKLAKASYKKLNEKELRSRYKNNGKAYDGRNYISMAVEQLGLEK